MCLQREMKDFDAEGERNAAFAVQPCSDVVADKFRRIYEWLIAVHYRNLAVADAVDHYLMMNTDKLLKHERKIDKNTQKDGENNLNVLLLTVTLCNNRVVERKLNFLPIIQSYKTCGARLQTQFSSLKKITSREYNQKLI